MKNWKDYVGFQPINEADFKNTTKPLNAFYLTHLDNITAGFRILRFPFKVDEVVLTDEEVGTRVEELLNEFPQIKIEDETDLADAKNQVAQRSKRGQANTNYNNTWYYQGATAFDAPIIVCGIDGKYIVLKHPNFDVYGFNVS